MTTYAQQMIRLTLIHSIIGTAEEAVCRVHVTGLTELATHDLFDLLDDADLLSIASAWNDLLSTTTGLYWANYSQLMSIKASLIATTGKYANPVAKELSVADQDWIGGQSNIIPEGSVCVSLATERTIHKRGHGRIYLPHTSMLLATDQAVAASGTCTDIATAAAAWISATNAVTNAHKTGAGIVLASKFDTAEVGPALVTRVGVDGVVDVQQRRRRQLVSAKQWVELV